MGFGGDSKFDGRHAVFKALYGPGFHDVLTEALVGIKHVAHHISAAKTSRLEFASHDSSGTLFGYGIGDGEHGLGNVADQLGITILHAVAQYQAWGAS